MSHGKEDVVGELVGFYLMSVQILNGIKECQDKEGRAVDISDKSGVFELKSGELTIIHENVKEWIALFLALARAAYQARLKYFRFEYKDTIDAFKSVYLSEKIPKRIEEPYEVESWPPKMEGKLESENTAL